MPQDRVTAVAAISASGAYAVQGQEAARGLQVWADLDDIDLQLVDDEGSPALVVDSANRRAKLSS